MIGSFSAPRAQFLVQGSAPANIEQLVAAANAKQGQFSFKCIVDHCDFQCIASSVVVGFNLGFRSIKNRFDIVTTGYDDTMIFKLAVFVPGRSCSGRPP